MDRNYDRGAASNFCSMYYGLQLWPDSRPVSSTGRALSRLSAGSPVRVRTLSVVTACDMQSQLVKVLHFHVLSRAVRKKKELSFFQYSHHSLLLSTVAPFLGSIFGPKLQPRRQLFFTAKKRAREVPTSYTPQP